MPPLYHLASTPSHCSLASLHTHHTHTFRRVVLEAQKMAGVGSTETHTHKHTHTHTHKQTPRDGGEAGWLMSWLLSLSLSLYTISSLYASCSSRRGARRRLRTVTLMLLVSELLNGSWLFHIALADTCASHVCHESCLLC